MTEEMPGNTPWLCSPPGSSSTDYS